MKCADNVEVRLMMSGKDLEQEGIVIEYVLSRMHQLYYVPFVEIAIIDSRNYFSMNGIPDGSEFAVFQGAGDQVENPDYWTVYRKFNARPSDIGGVKRYTITAYLSAGHRYLNERMNKQYAGTSSKVIADMLTDVGLDFEVVTTFDASNFYCSNRTMCEMIYQDIIPKAFCREESCITAGLAFDAKLRVVDLSRIIRGAPKAHIANMQYEGAEYLAAEWSDMTNSGIMNKAGGWGMKTFTNDLVNGVKGLLSGVTVSKKEKSLDVDPKSQVTSAVHISPLNIGNINENNEAAGHQNKRMRSLYSSETHVLVRNPTGLNLFDLVQFSAISGTELNARASGFFVLVGKAVYTSQKEYAEKLIMVRNASNSDAGVSQDQPDPLQVDPVTGVTA